MALEHSPKPTVLRATGAQARNTAADIMGRLAARRS